jgi:hypothetical protein
MYYRPTILEVVAAFTSGLGGRYRCLRVPAQLVRSVEWSPPLAALVSEVEVIVQAGVIQVHRRDSPVPFMFRGHLVIPERDVALMPSVGILRGTVEPSPFSWTSIFPVTWEGEGHRAFLVTWGDKAYGAYHYSKTALWSDNEDTDPAPKHRIYLASSWRNGFQPRILQLLRAEGHEVYDFRNPTTVGGPPVVEAGFSWREIDPDWQQWTPEQYREALGHPLAQRGYDADFAAMQWSDTCVQLLPSGPSAAQEAGWCKGSGRRLIVHVAGMREPDLMIKMADAITITDEELLAEVARGP